MSCLKCYCNVCSGWILFFYKLSLKNNTSLLCDGVYLAKAVTAAKNRPTTCGDTGSMHSQNNTQCVSFLWAGNRGQRLALWFWVSSSLPCGQSLERGQKNLSACLCPACLHPQSQSLRPWDQWHSSQHPTASRRRGPRKMVQFIAGSSFFLESNFSGQFSNCLGLR